MKFRLFTLQRPASGRARAHATREAATFAALETLPDPAPLSSPGTGNTGGGPP